MKKTTNYSFCQSAIKKIMYCTILTLGLLISGLNVSQAQVGSAINHNEDYIDLDNDDTYAGGPLRVGMLQQISGKNWSGITQVDANLNGTGAGKYAGLLIDSDNRTERDWNIWMQSKQVLLDANYIRFKNNGTDGLVWGNTGWSYIYSRIMDDGDLKIQTNNDFYIQDIDNDGGSVVTRFFIDTEYGKVGIGDSDPSTTLNVVGPIRASDDANETEYLEMEHGGSNAYLNYKGDGNLDFRYNATTYMQMTNAGKFGVGGDFNPTEYLEVKPDEDQSAIIGRAHIGYNGTDGDWASFAHTDMNNSTGYAMKQSWLGTTKINTATGMNMHFDVGGTTKMWLNSSGYFGIGTGPTVPLHVKNDDSNGQLLVEPASATGQDGMITIRGARYNDAGGNQAKVVFENNDDNVIQKMGMISGSVTDAGANVGDLVFYTYVDGTTSTETLRLTSDGETTTNTLYVKTQAVIKQLEIDPDKTTWPDYVFESDYELRTLSEVEGFVEKNGHLPEVPSAAEVAENGIDVYEMQELMMKKIEELTLYMIDLKKENTALKSRMDQLSK